MIIYDKADQHQQHHNPATSGEKDKSRFFYPHWGWVSVKLEKLSARPRAVDWLTWQTSYDVYCYKQAKKNAKSVGMTGRQSIKEISPSISAS